MKRLVKKLDDGYEFKGYKLSKDYTTISKGGDTWKSICLRYGDRIAWFIAEVESIEYKASHK